MIHFQRMSLRPLEEGDLEFFGRLFTDPDTLRFWPPSWKDEQGLRKAFSGMIADSADSGRRRWILMSRAGNDRIGYGMAREQDGGILIGYIIDPLHRGAGHATEFAGGVIALAFAEPSVERVWATVHPENRHSVRVLQKSGMVFRSHDEAANRSLYSITRAEWNSNAAIRAAAELGSPGDS